MKHLTGTIFSAGLLMALLPGCQKDEHTARSYPEIHTSSVENITADGARFSAAIISGSLEDITEYGFVWGGLDILNLEYSHKAVCEGSPANNRFSTDITYSLETGQNYFVRAYVKTDRLVIFGDAVKFVSEGCLKPVLTDYEPKMANWGDTVTINGNNFGFQKNDIIVRFGIYGGTVVSCNNTEIKVLVPPEVNQAINKMSITISGNLFQPDTPFTLNIHGTINAVNNKKIKWGDSLTLYGTFNYPAHQFSIAIDGQICPIVNISNTQILCQVPAVSYADSVIVQLIDDGHPLKGNLYLKMTAPYISHIVESGFGWDDTITITGLFDPDLERNEIFLDRTMAVLVQAEIGYLKFVVPVMSTSTCHLYFRSMNIMNTYPDLIELAGPEIISAGPLILGPGENFILKGKYFLPGQMSVKLGSSYSAKLVYSSTTQITATTSVYIPPGTYSLEVIVLGKTATYGEPIQITN